MTSPILALPHAAPRLSIVELDGFHGHLEAYPSGDGPGLVGGAARLSTEIQHKRDQGGDVLLLSGGDFFTGPPVSSVFDGKPVIEVMNRDGFDAMTLGNHDFDKGQEVLAQRISEARFPVLGANLLEARSGRPVGETDHVLKGVKPYTIKTMQGARVAVIGLLKPDTPQWTHPDLVKGLSFEDPAATLKRLVPTLMQKENPDLVVLHYSMLQQAPDLARCVREAAMQATGQAPSVLVVGGHNYPDYSKPVRDGDTMILEGTDRGSHLNELDLRIDPRTRRIVSYWFTRKAIDDAIEPDPEVNRIVGAYRARLSKVMDQPLAVSAAHLTRGRTSDGPMGNLVTDCLRDSVRADFAFLSGGSIKSDLLPGVVTVGALMSALPFDNHVVTLEMTGREVRKALEESVSLRGGGKVLQMAGLEMVCDPEAEIPDRVVQIHLPGGRKLDDDAVYTVAADDFLCAGGDHYTAFQGHPTAHRGPLVRDLVIEQLKRRVLLDAEDVHRIAFACTLPRLSTEVREACNTPATATA